MIAESQREAFRKEVTKLRDEGWSWAEVAELTGRPMRTCKRALDGRKKCARRGCPDQALLSGQFCTEHARKAMRNKPGQGERQQEVLRLLRKHGHMTSEQLRQATGIDAVRLGQVTKRLVRLGLIERPMRGHYTMPRPPEFVPEQTIEPTPDRIGLHRD